MKHAVEIILTLSATFKGSADQQSVDGKTEISLSLDMTTYFLKYPSLSLKDRRGQSHEISWSLSFAVCLGLLSANLLASVQISMVNIMLSLLTYLIFGTHARSVKLKYHSLTKKENTQMSRLLRLLYSSAVMLVNRDSPSQV